MANNATFDELTVNTLNIAKTGTMRIKSASSVDMQVGDNCRIIVGDTKGNKKVVNIVSDPLYINGQPLNNSLSNFITDVFVNDEAARKENGRVYITVPTADSFLPITGGTLTGDLYIQGETAENTTSIIGDNVTTSQITADKITLTKNDITTIILGDTYSIKSGNTEKVKISAAEVKAPAFTCDGTIAGNLITGDIQTSSISQINNTPISIGNLEGLDATFSNITISTNLTVQGDTTLDTLTSNTGTVESTSDENNSIVNVQYLNNTITNKINDTLALLNCKLNLTILTNDNKFSVYVKKNVACDYTVVKTGVVYKTDSTKNNLLNTAEEDVIIGNENVQEVNLSDTDRKKILTTNITPDGAGLYYAIRGYIIVSKDNVQTTIYTNAEVTSWNDLHTNEKIYPYIWLEEND